jgi:Domain of unknown function (DUF4436)
VSLARRLARSAVLLIVLAGLVTAGLLMYHSDRDSRQQAYTTGDNGVADRLDLQVTIEKMNPAAQQLTLRFVVIPQGRLATGPGSTAPARDLTVETTSQATPVLRYPASQPARAAEVTVDAPGIASDYPFDRYDAAIGFAASAGGEPVPVTLTLDDADPSFSGHVTRGGQSTAGYTFFHVTESRSRSTLILALMMMAIMWALALTVAAASWTLVKDRRGLIFPAMSWMAATLFALAAFRNAAPGSPPVGAVLDYAAYLWAELIVALSLVIVTATGIRNEATTAPVAR